MTVPAIRRLQAERLFRPGSVALLGAATPDGAAVLSNLRQGGFSGPVWCVGAGTALADLPGTPDLAVIAGPAEDAAASLRALAEAGCAAAIFTGPVADLGTLAEAAGMRVLGPNSFGLAVPGIGLNASLSHMMPPPGHVALVTQSAALARAVVDWAGPNGVGFSHVVGIGGNADIGFGAVLDWLSRDPDTRLILLDIRRVRERRAFISAARAASRLRPVVALRPGGLLLDETGRADRVFEAALNRAGVLVVERMEALLAATETLSRAHRLHGETLAVVTNAIGPGRLAADAALRAGIRLAILPPEAQASLTASLPADLLHGLIYAGSAAPTDVASITAMVSAVPSLGGILVLLAPTGPGDAAAVESVIAATHTARLPILTCAMGETTGAALRRRLAEAGVPAFATPEQAVDGFSHLLRERAAHRAARELPPSRVLAVEPDHEAAQRCIAAADADGRLVLTAAETACMLAAYGLAAPAGPAGAALHVHDDAAFGPAIGLAVPAGAAAAYGLPPLNLTLAQDLARRAGLSDPALIDVAAGALVRVSQMVVDLPRMAGLDVVRQRLEDTGAGATGALRLHPPGRRSELAISPYPEQLAHRWSSHGQDFLIRPIRPEDAASHAALVRRVPAEDLRFRFFSSTRQVAPEQMARLTQIDYDREMAFIAVRLADQETVGVARLVSEGAGRDGRGGGEFAILAQPDAKGLGLSRHLMECLFAWARSRGLARVSGLVLADNHSMLGFVRHLGFTLDRVPGDGETVQASIDLQPR